MNQVDVRCKAYRDCIVLCICKNARVSDLLFLERIVEESQSAYRHDSGFVGGRMAILPPLYLAGIWQASLTIQGYGED